MIEVKHLTKYFGPVLAVDDINFQVAKGEVVGFLGNNGAGKTTTMRILTTYLPATSGVATVAGFDVMSQSMEVRRNIGYLPENVPLYHEMRVEEYLDYRAKLKGVPRKERQRRIDHCLDRCRIREVRRRLNGTLSKGYRQRVGLADSMIHDPPILILDEPTVGLDPVQRRETLALIRELGHSHTIMLSTHILAEVEAVCERVLIINMGRLGLAKKLTELETDSVIVLEVRGPTEQIAGALRATDGVAQVSSLSSPGDGLAAFEVRTRGNQDLRERISERMAKNGWVIRRLDLRRRNLEDRFLEVLREQDPLKLRLPPPASESVQDRSAQGAVTQGAK
jgi:ABC-2 type transport system ATP-binding protein